MNPGERVNLRSVGDMNAAIQRNLWRIPADTSLVVGVPRSGLLAANLLALYLNLPITDVDGFLDGRLLAAGKRRLRMDDQRSPLQRGSRILVVDDCVSQGTEMAKVRERLRPVSHQYDITYLAVYSFPEGVHRVDLAFDVVPRPAAFEWSLFHSAVLGRACLDIDGVLCVDPTPDEDDDGENYSEFLANARPLMLPTTTVGTLVTSRLEHYRAATEAWLEEHDVAYNRLVMMDHSTADDRRRANRQAHFKAKVYRDTKALLFIESSPGLAHQIAQLAGKPVLAYGTGELAVPSLRDRVQVRVQRLGWHVRRVRRAPRKLASRLRSRGLKNRAK